MKGLYKKLPVMVLALIISQSIFAQSLSELQRSELKKKFDTHIKTVSAISADKTDMIAVYSYQIEKAEQFLEENQRYASDKEIYSKTKRLWNS